MANTDFLYEDRKYLPGERQFLLYQYLLKNTCKGHAVTRKQILDFHQFRLLHDTDEP